MTTRDAIALVDATEQVLAYLDKQPLIDSFLEQTVHACEHGVNLTELGRLILSERLQMKPLVVANN